MGEDHYLRSGWCFEPPSPAPAGLFRVLCIKEDSRPRLWKAMKEWEWTPLISCLQIQV